MYHSDSNNDSDEEIFSKKCFNVELPEDFDPNAIPTTGEEYLQHVLYEARTCDRVRSVDIDSRKYEKNQTFWISEGADGYVSAPSTMLPSREWQENTVKEFSDYREYVASIVPNTLIMPCTDYLYWMEKMSVNYPQLPVICSFNDFEQSKLLEQIIKNLASIREGLSVDKILGCWIYNILSVLQKPLIPDNYLLLRDISRACSKIRSKLASNASSELYTPLNVFICIIGRYFGQLDLTDK